MATGTVGLLGATVVGRDWKCYTRRARRFGSRRECALESADRIHRPVIVDTDLSFDDYVALLYLLQHPAIDVRAITVVNGVVHVKPGVENARRLLALVGRTDIPVAGGPDGPLTDRHAFPGRWRTLLDYGPRLLLPRTCAIVPGPSAPELICQQSLAGDDPITLVMLGPLTNLARALRSDPSLASRIEMVYVSGGAIDVPGTIHANVPSNPNRVAEWNIYLDVGAADLVFRAGIPITLVPLDVTHVTGPQPLLFSRDCVRRLRLSARGRTSRLMVRLISWWQSIVPQYAATPVWDAAVAAVVADPAVGTEWRHLAIRVATQPEDVAGRTVVEAVGRPNVQVCLGGDQTALEASYLAVARDGSDRPGSEVE